MDLYGVLFLISELNHVFISEKLRSVRGIIKEAQS